MMTRIVQISGLVVGLALLAVGPGISNRAPVAWAVEAPDLQTFTVKVDGMTCAGCVKDIQSAILKVPGVKAVEFQIKKWLFFHDYSDTRVIIRCEPGETTVDSLITAIESASSLTSTYKAKSLS